MKTTAMKLTVYERLTIPGILPAKGNYEAGIKIRDIREKCELTQDELKRINFRTVQLPNGNVNAQWDEKKVRVKEVLFTELELLLIQNHLKELDKKEELPVGDRQFMRLYERFTIERKEQSKSR